MITIIPILFNNDLDTIKQMFLEWSLLWRDARCDVVLTFQWQAWVSLISLLK